MKNVIRASCLMAVLFFCYSLSFAGSGAKKSPQTMSNGVLKIMRASQPPKIDGILDDEWKAVDAVPMVKLEGHSTDSILANMHEHYASFRAMWDPNNLYVFVSVVDSSLEGVVDRGSPWNDDCVEFFLNGADTTLSTSYDATCAQWRYDWPEQVGDTGTVGNIMQHTKAIKAVQTPTGYNLEFAIPKDSLPGKFNFLTKESQIGFEISSGDRKGSVAQNSICHWWTNNGLTWSNPQLFGQAIMDTSVAAPVMVVYHADPKHPVTIDGTMSAGEWDNAPEVSMNQIEGGRPLDSLVTQWRDHQGFFRLLWDESNLYIFVTVLDSSLEGVVDRGSPWNDDCVEVFLNGADTTLSTSYDATCAQWRYDYPENVGDTGTVGNLLAHTAKVAHKTFNGAPGSNLALASLNWTGTANGYTLEIAVPKDSLPGNYNFLKTGSQVGFEISSGDRKGSIAQNSITHWWTNNGLTWSNPQLFGQIQLTGQVVGVQEQKPPVATTFSLNQNYPNPFNPTTKISYSLNRISKVRLSICNVLGQEVAVLENGVRSVGNHTVDFDGAKFASGVYFYKLDAGNQLLVKKMMLLK